MADHITEIGAERMLRGVELLMTVDRRLFDMACFYKASLNHCGSIGNPKMHDSPVVTCRSKACALGWMGSDPWFRRRGLKLEIEHYALSYSKRWGESRLSGEVHCDGKQGMRAAMAFFGISFPHAIYLFGNPINHNSGKTPKQVAKAMRRFVLTGETP